MYEEEDRKNDVSVLSDRKPVRNQPVGNHVGPAFHSPLCSDVRVKSPFFLHRNPVPVLQLSKYGSEGSLKKSIYELVYQNHVNNRILLSTSLVRQIMHDPAAKAMSERQLIEFMQQITDTCQAYKELAHYKYPPGEFNIAGDGFVRARDAQNVENVQHFVDDNKENFNQQLVISYADLITREVGHDPAYEDGSQFQETFYQKDDTDSDNPRFQPVVEGKTYCIYRSMPREQFTYLKDNYDRLKEQLNNGNIVIDDTGMRLNGPGQDFVNSIRADGILTGHAGDVEAAVSYGGILVKFEIDPGKSSMLTDNHFNTGIQGGETNRVINNRITGGEGGIVKYDVKIGAKSEQRGAGFSFYFGNKKSGRAPVNPAVLFLSTVKKITGYDLRKRENTGITRKLDMTE